MYRNDVCLADLLCCSNKCGERLLEFRPYRNGYPLTGPQCGSFNQNRQVTFLLLLLLLQLLLLQPRPLFRPGSLRRARSLCRTRPFSRSSAGPAGMAASTSAESSALAAVALGSAYLKTRNPCSVTDRNNRLEMDAQIGTHTP